MKTIQSISPKVMSYFARKDPHGQHWDCVRCGKPASYTKLCSVCLSNDMAYEEADRDEMYW